MAEDIWAQLDAYNKKYPDTDGDSDADGKPTPKKKKKKAPMGDRIKGRGLLQNAIAKRKERRQYVDNAVNKAVKGK